MTPFETALSQVQEGKLTTPEVASGKGQIDYFWYQLSVHHFNLKLMSKGIMSRGIKLKDLKHYYGLKGRTANDCLSQYEAILENYKSRYLVK